MKKFVVHRCSTTRLNSHAYQRVVAPMGMHAFATANVLWVRYAYFLFFCLVLHLLMNAGVSPVLG